MSRILFAWELGTSYGYIAQLLPFARALKERGHHVALAVRELHHISRVPNDRGIPVFQAPIWIPTVHGLPEPPLNYAEMMLRFGYHDPFGLAGVVNAWRALMSLYQTDFLVACHAPTALLAARTCGVKSSTLGTGFYVPPCSPTPNMRPWVAVPGERLESSDRTVLKAMNSILRASEKPELGSLSELFDTEENFLCTFPEIDQYSGRENAKYWGTAYDSEMGRRVGWPDGDGKKVVVYMGANHRDFLPVMQAIKVLGLKALVFAVGISDNLRQQLSSSSVFVSETPIHFDDVLSRCDMAICHAGHGTTSRMLLAGVPMLLFASHLEQYLLALRVKQLGAGEVVNQEKPAPDFVVLLKEMLESIHYKKQAQSFAQKHADFSSITQITGICDRIEEILTK